MKKVFLLCTVCFLAAVMPTCAVAQVLNVAAGVANAVQAAVGGKPAAEDMQRWCDHQARHLVLGWKEGRLELDLLAMRAGALGPDFDRNQAALQATLEKAPKLVNDEAVANGLPREIAEKMFADIGRPAADERFGGFNGSVLQQLFFGHQSRALMRGMAGMGNAPKDPAASRLASLMGMNLKADSGPIVWLAVATKSAEEQGILSQGGSSGGGRGELRLERGNLRLEFSEENAPLAYSVSRVRTPRWDFTLTDGDGPALSISWHADRDPDGDKVESLRIRQTADGIRIVHSRNDETVMKLEGTTFRDCCLTHPEIVRRDLVPLLRSIGVGTPAMPEDDVVKTAVVARLRQDAGLPRAEDETKRGVSAAQLEAAVESARHRLAQATAAIDAFRLLDDADYLASLKKTATGDDAAAIDARLSEIGKR